MYCPPGDVSHLFEERGPTLIDLDEAFVAPCVLNEHWCGGARGSWTPRVRLIGLQPDERFDKEEGA